MGLSPKARVPKGQYKSPGSHPGIPWVPPMGSHGLGSSGGSGLEDHLEQGRPPQSTSMFTQILISAYSVLWKFDAPYSDTNSGQMSPY